MSGESRVTSHESRGNSRHRAPWPTNHGRHGRRRTASRPKNPLTTHDSRLATRLQNPLTTRDSRLATRHAVTLVELLITIAIIAILAAAFLGVSGAAMESAREARTKTTIGKIHTLLMEKWAEYQTRRVDVDTSVRSDDGFGIQSTSSRNRGILITFARLDATRILMKQEMPDRWSDILHDTVANRPPGQSDLPAPIRIVKDATVELGPDNNYDMWLTYPAVARTYLRRYNSLLTQDVETIEENQGAECLYLTIMLTTGDGEARSLFSESDIGDTDGDGAQEFLDGWGRPIHYIRWPAGFAEAGRSDLMSANAETDHDPFDAFRVQIPPIPTPPGGNRGYRLVPLIYSAGADGITDLYEANDAIVLNPYARYSYQGIDAKLGIPLNPFAAPLGIGSADNDDGENYLDNIHNHLQDNR